MKKKFPVEMRSARDRAGRSLSQLADGCNMSTNYLSDVEQGRCLPPCRESVMAIARELRTKPTALLAAARSDVIDHALRQWRQGDHHLRQWRQGDHCYD